MRQLFVETLEGRLLLAGDADFFVRMDGGADTNDCTSWESACASVQTAIQKATSGDTISIDPGTYYENLTRRQGCDADRCLVRFAADAQPTPIDAVILDGSQEGRVIQVSSGVTATLENLIVTNGMVIGENGENAGPAQDAPPDTDVPGEDGDSGGAGEPALGGGIYNRGDLTLVNVRVSENTVVGGGGGSGGQGGDGADRPPPVESPPDCCTHGEIGPVGGSGGMGGVGGDGGAAQGGGIYNEGMLNLIDSFIVSNAANGGDGGSGGSGGQGGNAADITRGARLYAGPGGSGGNSGDGGAGRK